MAKVENSSILSPKGTFPATVAEVIDDYKIVINRGKQHNLEKGQRMLVYRVSEEDIKDPETGESLGYLELVLGTGKIIYVQEKMAIIESDKRERTSASHLGSLTITPEIRQLMGLPERKLPFDKPQVGDKVKPI